MPTNFYSFAWPIAFSIIVLAGLIVILAALTTLVAAITKARQLGREKDDQAPQVEEYANPYQKATYHPDDWSTLQTGVLETVTTDGIHYIPTH